LIQLSFCSLIMASRPNNKRKRHLISDTNPDAQSSTRRNDERCRKCKEWAFNPDHFRHHFVRCTRCQHSYHRRCVEPILKRKNKKLREFQSCSVVHYQCSDKRNQPPSTLFSFVDAPYWSRQYTFAEGQSLDGVRKKCFVDPPSDCDPRNQANAGKQSQKRWRRDYYQSVRFKEMTLSVGDSVEIRNANSETAGPQWPTNVAMIREIYDDQMADTPILSIFWYWRERELKWEMESKDRRDVKLQNESVSERRRQSVDHHIYCDTDYVAEVPLDTVTNRAVVFEQHSEFRQFVDGAAANQEAVRPFYGELFVSGSELRFVRESKAAFKERQFEAIRLRRARKSKVPAPQKTEAKAKVKWDDIPIAERLRLGMAAVCDSSSSESSGGSGSPLAKRAKRRQIVQENIGRISADDMASMEALCQRFGLGKGPNIGSRLYEFTSHRAAYQSLDALFRRHNAQSITSFVAAQKQSWCRDIKSALYTKGQIVPLAKMKENIVRRIKELMPRYAANTANSADIAATADTTAGGHGVGEPPLKKRRVV